MKGGRGRRRFECGSKREERENETVLNEWMGGNVWDPRSIQIPRFRTAFPAG